MDPYCIIRFGKQQFESKVAEDMGQFPKWN